MEDDYLLDLFSDEIKQSLAVIEARFDKQFKNSFLYERKPKMIKRFYREQFIFLLNKLK